MPDQKLTALVMAGGTVSGKDAAASGTNNKALAVLGGQPLVSRVVDALGKVDAVTRIIVVGPAEIGQVIGGGAHHCLSSGTLLGNVQAGVRFAGLQGDDRILLVGADLAFPNPDSFADFIERSPQSSKVTVPLVSCRAFDRAYPNSGSSYAKLRDGEFTIGSQFTSPASILIEPPPGIAAALGSRKSQIQLGLTFGPSFLLGLLTKSLTIEAIERRSSQILTVPSTAVRDCAPDLAFDIDGVGDLVYARRICAADYSQDVQGKIPGDRNIPIK